MKKIKLTKYGHTKFPPDSDDVFLKIYNQTLYE